MNGEYAIVTCGRAYNSWSQFYSPAYVVNRIYYIVNGNAYYKDDISLKKGYLYLFRADPEFRVRQEENHPLDHVYFDFVTYQKFIDSDYIEIDVSNNKCLLYLMKAMEADFVKLPLEAPKITERYLEILMYYLKNYLSINATYSATITEALDLMHHIPAAELTVNGIAERIHKNVDYLIRCFKKELGTTPHKYIATWKTDLAISYLRQGMSGTEIADILGFDSLASFCYYFKRETGKTITQIKAEL